MNYDFEKEYDFSLVPEVFPTTPPGPLKRLLASSFGFVLWNVPLYSRPYGDTSQNNKLKEHSEYFHSRSPQNIVIPFQMGLHLSVS